MTRTKFDNMNHTRTEVSVIPNCDLCKGIGTITAAKYDGATVYGPWESGPWAYMCEDCFIRYGQGLGLGRGQELILAAPKTESAE